MTTPHFPLHEHRQGAAMDDWYTAVAGVLRLAQEGELPLFACSLGMRQEVLTDLLAQCIPDMGDRQALLVMPLPARLRQLQPVPDEFIPLKDLLLEHRPAGVHAQKADVLAHAIAAASFGSRHLWQDLGLPGRDAVSALMREYFETLYLANIHNLKWKRFLFAELGRKQGKTDLRPPKCTHCDDFHVCFPDSATRT
ncbi:nitrogen fixation protein NifQ [Undibacterium sp. CY18W]|uniref:Nitrogen fixation protein NifQ n=1 Tax=Undibacterium hunanense TaxID=2762292 RepID=A0ABR6ZVL9_9BURK|nr:nitrogen fixation protein NifQ [Undibacterium hunanense]MBC3919917.1 nitrogen fixation protein NifQ [Undibacterium hunanense]